MTKKKLLILTFLLGLVSVFGQKNKDFFSVIERQAKISDGQAKETFKVDKEEYLDYFNFIKDTIVNNQYLVIYEYYTDGPPETSVYLGLFNSNGFPISYTKLISCELDCPDEGYSFIVDHSIIEITAIYIKISDEVYSRYYDSLTEAQKGMPFGQRNLIKKWLPMMKRKKSK
ncbi:hypothetical protein [Flagellimonas sp. GZD32]|uniref:hypothetical protein n=1 Tax=Flagellimonas cixiensis TaxID=3228750 RepID=UPI0035C9136E